MSTITIAAQMDVGLQELAKKLAVLSNDMKSAGRLVKPGMQEAIQVFHDAVDPRIPVDTGELKLSHSTSGVKHVRNGFVIADGVYGYGDNSPLAQEFGNAKTRAQPFITPTFQAKKQEMLEVFKKVTAWVFDYYAKTGRLPPEQTTAKKQRASFGAQRRRASASLTAKRKQFEFLSKLSDAGAKGYLWSKVVRATHFYDAAQRSGDAKKIKGAEKALELAITRASTLTKKDQLNEAQKRLAKAEKRQENILKKKAKRLKQIRGK